MKTIFGILSVALAAPVNQCPGTCWTETAGVCSPDLNELTITCGAGYVDITANACLFLPSSANLTDGYEVKFGGTHSGNIIFNTLFFNFLTLNLKLIPHPKP